MVGTVTGRPVFSVKTIELRGWWGEDSTEALSPWGQILYEQMKYFKREGQKAKTTDSALGYSCLSQLFSYSRHPGLSGPPLPLSPMTPIQAQNSGHCFRCWADGNLWKNINTEIRSNWSFSVVVMGDYRRSTRAIEMKFFSKVWIHSISTNS